MKGEALKILLVEDSQSFRDGVIQLLGVYNDVEGAEDLASARAALKRTTYDIVILDKGLPDGNGINLIPEIKAENPNTVVIMLTADSDFNTIQKAKIAGADDYAVKSEHIIADLLVRIPFVVERAAGDRQLRSLQAQVRESFRYEIIGKSLRTAELREQILSIKGSNTNVLITGESGTGKELIARRLHALTEDRRRPFVAINCGAIPGTLIEEELFGHQKGTFTSAHADKPGKFELAHNGDLFLDEIGDLPLEAQAKLLRVMEDRSYFRVGGTKPINASCRIIAATNKNLEDLVQQKLFREDLFYRLNIVRIHTTPLRDRMEDIPDLAKYFVLTLGGISISISEGAIARLVRHAWPGNIRELRNVIERGILKAKYRFSKEPGQGMALELKAQDISLDELTGPAATVRQLESALPLEISDVTEQNYQEFMHAAERQYLLSALQATNGNVPETGVRLGMSRSTMFRKMSELGIQRRTYTSESNPSGLRTSFTSKPLTNTRVV